MYILGREPPDNNVCTYILGKEIFNIPQKWYTYMYLLGVIEIIMYIRMYVLGREPPDNNVHMYVTYLSHTYVRYVLITHVRTYLLGILDPR